MNEKLKEKCIEYISTNFTIDETMMEGVPLSDRQYVFWIDDVSKLAEHFYNLAIANIRKEIEERRDFMYARYIKKGIGCMEESRYDQCVELLDFIDNLTK